MSGSRATFSREAFRRILLTLGVFLKSPVGGKAKWLLAGLFVLMFSINGMNVLNSFVGRNFMSAIESRDSGGFVRLAWLYVAVFAGSTFVGVTFRFTEERLGLLWRDFLTHRVVGLYIDRVIYLHMSREGSVSNPDQRITEDIRREVEFGVIGLATMAFATLLGAFSLIITQFQAISAYASVLLRLGEFVEAAEKCDANTPGFP
ncbi:MAG: hypothetical protein RLZZ214_3106 [Verrucomicrobiota bacterium]|jgi:putative ATP-binding cassette transporter